MKSYFSKIIHSSVNPFDDINPEQLEKLSFTYNLRNYLSHYSAYSKRKLHLSYKKKYNYKKFIEPGSFLIKNNGKNYETILHNFILISVVMRKKLGV